MLDPDEYAAYEAWKQTKLTTHPDLSVQAFNTEMTAQAVAYDEALEAVIGRVDWQKLQSFKSSNPYRQPGMRGHNAALQLSAPPVVIDPAVQPKIN